MAFQFQDVIVALVVTSAMTGAMVASARSADQLLAAVCSGNGLVCVSNDLIREFAKEATVRRDPSINTVNDLQKDFFPERTLVEGEKMTLDENLRDSAARVPFLSPSAAASLPPIETSSAAALVRHFGLTPSSRAATDVATAAYLCGSEALIPSEAKLCAASLDAIRGFVAAELGRTVTVYSTSGAPSSPPVVKSPVTISKATKGSLEEGKKIVVCHHLAFPSMLYSCHAVTGTKVVHATLNPRNSTPIKAVGVCHMHNAHGAEACHFLVENDLVFVPTIP